LLGRFHRPESHPASSRIAGYCMNFGLQKSDGYESASSMEDLLCRMKSW
jgi:hypothetical protein